MDIVVIVLGGFLFLLFYFIPTLIARDNKKSNKDAIFALNLFLGWSFIGWIVALIWATTKDKPNIVEKIIEKHLEKEVHKFDYFYELGRKNEFKKKNEDAIDNYMDALYHLENDYTDLQEKDIEEINTLKLEINNRIKNLKTISS